MNNIEQEYSKLQSQYHSRSKSSTGMQDVLQLMLDRPNKIWWFSYQFIGLVNSKGVFLSHRSPARASDLALHTNFVEDRRIGRLKVYRLRTENMKYIEEYLNNK